MDNPTIDEAPPCKHPLLVELQAKAQELLGVFELLPAKFQMDGLDIFQSTVNTVVKKITHGRVSSVKFVPVEDKPKKTPNDSPAAATQPSISSLPDETVPEIKTEPSEETDNNDSTNTNTQASPAGPELSTYSKPPAAQSEVSSSRKSARRREDTVTMDRVVDSAVERALMEAMTPLGSGRRAAMLASMRIKQEVMSENEDTFSDDLDHVSDFQTEETENGMDKDVSSDDDFSLSKIGKVRRKKRKKVSFGLGGPYRCRHCSYTCTKKCDLQSHMNVHSGARAYECERCGKRFTAASSLRRHQMAHAGVKPFDCPICGKSFLELSHLRTHSVVHTGERLYRCDKCPKEYTNSANLSRHKRVHTGEKPYRCQECDVSFRDLSSLKLHTLKHTGEKPYLCDVCNKQFKTSSDFRRHERTHTGERNYKCSQCGKLFIQGWHLKQHQRMHNDERPWHCDQCGKQFRTKASLQHHTKGHKGIKDYTCTICKKSFSTKKYLQNHQVIHTAAKPFKCCTCGTLFNQYSNLKRHERIHSDERKYKCKVCNKTFKYINSLQYHEGIHRGDRKTCDKCGLSFRSKQGIARHRCDPTQYAENLARSQNVVVKLEVMDKGFIEEARTTRRTRSSMDPNNSAASKRSSQVKPTHPKSRVPAEVTLNKLQKNRTVQFSGSKTRGVRASKRGRRSRLTGDKTEAITGELVPEPGDGEAGGSNDWFEGPAAIVNSPRSIKRSRGAPRGRGRKWGGRRRVGQAVMPSEALSPNHPDPQQGDNGSPDLSKDCTVKDPRKEASPEATDLPSEPAVDPVQPVAPEPPSQAVTEEDPHQQDTLKVAHVRDQCYESQREPLCLAVSSRTIPQPTPAWDTNLSDIELMKKAYSGNICGREEMGRPQIDIIENGQ